MLPVPAEAAEYEAKLLWVLIWIASLREANTDLQPTCRDRFANVEAYFLVLITSARQHTGLNDRLVVKLQQAVRACAHMPLGATVTFENDCQCSQTGNTPYRQLVKLVMQCILAVRPARSCQRQKAKCRFDKFDFCQQPTQTSSGPSICRATHFLTASTRHPLAWPCGLHGSLVPAHELCRHACILSCNQPNCVGHLWSASLHASIIHSQLASKLLFSHKVAVR